jgi:hypothetical protein
MRFLRRWLTSLAAFIPLLAVLYLNDMAKSSLRINMTAYLNLFLLLPEGARNRRHRGYTPAGGLKP